MMKGLPQGYTVRPATMHDGDVILRMVNESSRRIRGRMAATPEQIRAQLVMPGIDLAQDTRLVFGPEGDLAALATCLHFAPHIHVQCDGLVAEEHLGRGIGTALLAWIENRAQRALELAPPDARVALMQSSDDRNSSAREFLEEHGFTACRHFVRMLIEMTAPPPQPEWPGGITVRAIDPDADLEPAFRAGREAFKDHWGHVETPLDEAMQRLHHRVENDPDFDPSLRFLAEEGDRIAAVCNASPQDGADASTGYIETIGVLRPWRRRGLAKAFLLHVFHVFYERGIRKVALHVDAESLTGATRLYEKAGMKVDEIVHAYEKELRPGVELSAQHLAA